MSPLRHECRARGTSNRFRTLPPPPREEILGEDAIVRAAVSDATQTTPLYEEHTSLGARMVPFAGYKMPVQYEGLVKEHHAVRSGAGLFDASHMGQLEVSGPDANASVNRLVTNDVERLTVGQALYTVCCREDGGILDDLLVYRLGTDRLLVVCNASNRTKIVAHFRTHCSDSNALHDRTDESALIALQGPRAFEVLRRAETQPLDLEPFHGAEVTVGGTPCFMARTGYTGEDGVELFCRADDAGRLWRRLLEVGHEFELVPAGLGARDTLRLEARLCLYGNEIDESVHPFEAGLGWVVKLDKDPFIGRDALRKLRAEPLKRRLIGFETVERGIGRAGYAITVDGQVVGRVTSGGPSPTLGKPIGLGYVPAASSKVGTPLAIVVRDKPVAARVVRTPFYKRTATA